MLDAASGLWPRIASAQRTRPRRQIADGFIDRLRDKRPGNTPRASTSAPAQKTHPPSATVRNTRQTVPAVDTLKTLVAHTRQ